MENWPFAILVISTIAAFAAFGIMRDDNSPHTRKGIAIALTLLLITFGCSFFVKCDDRETKTKVVHHQCDCPDKGD